MPWTTDANGRKKYRLSIYAKEELPTWDEMYNQVYLSRIFNYSSDIPEDQELDHYWKLPRKKILIASACNQLNKMIFEDGLKDKLIEFINKNIWDCCTDIRFTCEPIDPVLATEDPDRFSTVWNEACIRFLIGSDKPSPIYTYPLPTGEENPFIINRGIPRIQTNEISVMELYPILMFKPKDGKTDYALYCPKHNGVDQSEDYSMIMDFILKEMKEYFEGEGIGWKDKDGHLIESDPLKPKCPSGYDPAL